MKLLSLFVTVAVALSCLVSWTSAMPDPFAEPDALADPHFGGRYGGFGFGGRYGGFGGYGGRYGGYGGRYGGGYGGRYGW